MERLDHIIGTTFHLIEKFDAILSLTLVGESINLATTNSMQTLHNAVTLLKSHFVKLGLLTVNKPFTPSAICKVLEEISSAPLPSVLAIVETIDPSKWTQLFIAELKTTIRPLTAEFKGLLHKIQAISHNTMTNAVSNPLTCHDPVLSTAILCDACDKIQAMVTQGFSGFVTKRVLQRYDAFTDAVEELQQWAELEDDEEIDDVVNGDSFSSEGSLNEAFGPEKLPQDATELRNQLSTCLSKLKVIKSLIKQVVEKRLKTIPNPEASSVNGSIDITRLEQTIQDVTLLQDETDEMAAEFYDQSSDGAAKRMSQCIEHATRVCRSVRLDYMGNEDSFSQWCDTWEAVINAKG